MNQSTNQSTIDKAFTEMRERLLPAIAQQPYPLMFATVSGAHLYGFPSPDSDCDLRGVHVLPLADAIGLKTGQETIECSDVQQGGELDLVTHDIKKFFSLMLKRNGYVLEQVLSPLVVLSTPEFEELRAIAPDCVTRFHSKHYLGFANTQWKLLTRGDRPKRIKPLLYVYRVLLTGIHMMRSGDVEANLLRLNELYCLPHVDDLIQRKVCGAEAETLEDNELTQHIELYNALCSQLEEAAAASHLPIKPTATEALNDLLIRVRRAAT